MKNDETQRAENPVMPTREEISTVAGKAKLAIAELERKMTIERRVTTDDLVAHLVAMSEVFDESTRLLKQFAEVAECVVEVNERLYQHIAESPEGDSAGEGQ